MSWTAVPGEAPELADYIAGLWMVPDVRTFADGVAEIDFSSGGHSIEVTDVDNRFLNDTEADDGERVDLETCDQTAGQRDEEVEGDEIVQRAWAVVAVDAADERVAALIDPLQVETHEPLYAHGVQRCDFCRCGLSQRGLFVDGRLRGQLMSGNMCAKCFNAKGEGIGWGSGQLYARQPDGRWRMVAGWR